VWGGFFWDIRSKLGARAADSLVASAWQTFRPPDTSRSIVLAFMESLLSRAKERGKETLEAVRLAAIARKIPLPEQSR
jgi:hypothetical protein